MADKGRCVRALLKRGEVQLCFCDDQRAWGPRALQGAEQTAPIHTGSSARERGIDGPCGLRRRWRDPGDGSVTPGPGVKRKFEQAEQAPRTAIV